MIELTRAERLSIIERNIYSVARRLNGWPSPTVTKTILADSIDQLIRAYQMWDETDLDTAPKVARRRWFNWGS